MRVQVGRWAGARVALLVILYGTAAATAAQTSPLAGTRAQAQQTPAAAPQAPPASQQSSRSEDFPAELEAARERLAGELASAREGRRVSEELAAARNRLAEAAQEVARLTAEASAPFVRDLERRVTAVRARPALGLIIENAEGGVLVTGVTPGGPAADAGVLAGDLIVGIDGVDLAASGARAPADRLLETLARTDFGDRVALELRRDGELQRIAVQTREDEQAGVAGFVGRLPGQVFSVRPRVDALPNFGVLRPFGRWQELELVSLTPDLGAYFGTEAGLLVVRAPEDDELGLRDGDVILAIGERTPASPEHAMRILASFESGETLRLSILRHQQAATLEVELPESRTLRRR